MSNFFNSLADTLMSKHTHCAIHGADVVGDHSACVLNCCPYCNDPVTNGQIENGETVTIDERGRDDGLEAHRKCVRVRREP